MNVLFINPSRWGRGITPIWIASHAAVLKSRGHVVELFDATFFKDWAHNENAFNTANQQYRPSNYENLVVFSDVPVREALQSAIDAFRPDVIFFAAISSHIHGEGEYAAIQFANELISDLQSQATVIAGGLQPTAAPAETAARFANTQIFIRGESEMVLGEVVDALQTGASLEGIEGLVRRVNGGFSVAPAQPIISDLDLIGAYDYSLFDDQVFLRPYNGEVLRAVDYEMSRGCPFTCSYCVETVIQSYYGFTEHTPRGMLKVPKAYLRQKSAGRAFEEMSRLYNEKRVVLFRCQDTNFLTINRETLFGLADLLDAANLPIKLYIETRPEGINEGTIPLLKRLRVDGVGMGVELSTQDFREANLNRFADQPAIIRAFKLLRDAGLKRTGYNIIGLPDQTEESILDTVAFNRILQPDNVTVAFYSPYIGTEQQRKGAALSYFLDYEFDVDSQLRTTSRHSVLSPELLAFYKRNFMRLVREGTDSLVHLKNQEGLRG